MTAAQHSETKVTVIVPFYNARSTIERCVHSIMSQSLREMEVIFVNDGSRDGTFQLLNETLLQYPDRIDSTRVLFYTYRQGVAAANRAAMRAASGKYIIRCDADDEFTPGALQALASEADRTGADVIAAPYVHVSPRGEKTVKIEKQFPDINRMKLTIDNYGLWNKLLRRQLLDDNQIEPYADIDCWDDVVILARVFALNPTVATIDTPVYRHYVSPRAKTLSNAPRDTALRQHLLAALRLEQWFISRKLTSAHEPFLNRLKLLAKIKYLRGPNKDIATWKATFPEVNNRIMGVTRIPLHYRAMMRMVAIIPSRISQSIADALASLKKQPS